MKKFSLIILLAIIFLVAGFFIKQSVKQKDTQTARLKHVNPIPKETTILLGKDGFSPKETQIKTRTALRWKNISGEKQTVNSDNYPTNQLHRELNLGIFNDNSTVIHIFSIPGTYGYHNQFHPEQTGKVIVVD